MMNAYSRLDFVLAEKKMSVPELRRQMQKRGVNVNIKSLYRLNQKNEPLARLDLRVAGAICEICNVQINDLISFETPGKKLHRIPPARQKRLDFLMEKNSRGVISKREHAELTNLVQELNELMIKNAKILEAHRRSND